MNRFPTLGQIHIGGPDISKLMTLEKIAEMPSPRVLKTHLPFHLLPPRLVDTSKVNIVD